MKTRANSFEILICCPGHDSKRDDRIKQNCASHDGTVGDTGFDLVTGTREINCSFAGPNDLERAASKLRAFDKALTVSAV
jgi:hypothetical protein